MALPLRPKLRFEPRDPIYPKARPVDDAMAKVMELEAWANRKGPLHALSVHDVRWLVQQARKLMDTVSKPEEE